MTKEEILQESDEYCKDGMYDGGVMTIFRAMDVYAK